MIDQHPGTPWATAAQREKSANVAVEWMEGFDADYTKLEDRAKRAKVKVPKK